MLVPDRNEDRDAPLRYAGKRDRVWDRRIAPVQPGNGRDEKIVEAADQDPDNHWDQHRCRPAIDGVDHCGRKSEVVIAWAGPHLNSSGRRVE